MMHIGKNLLSTIAVLALMLSALVAQAAPGDNNRGTRPIKADLLTSGLLGSIGGTVGPDGALYVPQFAIGEITRIDPSSGTASTFASGLPPALAFIGLGGVFDVAFVGETAYALVSLVGPEDFGEASPGSNGIYRIDDATTPTLIADLGAFSAANAPTEPFDYFLQGGVPYALDAVDGGLLVTDGHHNRVLYVTLDGGISVLKQFGNVVPAGITTTTDRVYLAQTGAIVNDAEIGAVVSFDPADPMATRVVAADISMAVDVQFGPGRTLYALSQGVYGGGDPGTPAAPNTGSLLRLNQDGSHTVLLDGINLPTSLHFIGGTAYVVTLAGDVWKVRGVSGARRSAAD